MVIRRNGEYGLNYIDFEELINSDLPYVDKTDYLYSLIKKAPGMFFCARPQGFGKTLTLYTLEAIFKGKKNLFKGLKIYEKNYDWKEHPVIYLDLGIINAMDALSLEVQLNERIFSIADRYGIEIEHSKFCNINLRRLILCLGLNKDVVMLVDEYDKPLISNIFNPEIESMRALLSGFFDVIKASTDCVEFALITGETFSISHLVNNFEDISMYEAFVSLFGFTQKEVERYLSPLTKDSIDDKRDNKASYYEKIKGMYGGYKFSPYQEEPLYNPLSISKFFLRGGREFDCYWHDTKIIKPYIPILKKLEGVRYEKLININSIVSFDVLELASSNLCESDYCSFLFQMGYLNIKSYDDDDNKLLTLVFPNKEVKSMDYFLIWLDFLFL